MSQGHLPLDPLPGCPAPVEAGPLNGVRVIDLTTSIAGPYAGLLLADLGADVLKVERLTGDDTRHWGPPFLGGDALWFHAVNRNKRSLALDYSGIEGREILLALVDGADVVITNQMGPAQKKLGIDAETLRSTRPQLIHVSVTGFGLTGPNAHLAGYDLIAEGYSGVMDLTGPADAEPQKVGAPAADMLAGADAALATLSALYRRHQSGVGCAIDVSLTESMTRFMAPRIVPYLGSGELPRRTGAKDSVIAIYQMFETADLPLTLALGNDGIWRRFWTAVGHPERGLDPNLATNVLRRDRRSEIVEEIQALLLQRSRDEWLDVFASARVPAGPIYRLDEVTRDPHLLDRGLFYTVTRNGIRLPQVGLGIHFDGRPPGCGSPPPRLGEHTREVLVGRLGLEPAAVDELERRNLVSGPAAAAP